MIDIDSIKSAKYFTDSMSDGNYCINVEDDNGKYSVPIDTANTDYQTIQEWIAKGNTIEEAD
jgi:hypothetical protein